MEQYLDNEKQTVDEFEAELEKRVRDAMAAQFLLDEVAKAEEIGVEQEELSEHLFRRAQQSGQNPNEFIKHMVEHNHIPEMVAEVVRGKALAQIVEAATVTDASGNVVDLKNLRPDGTHRRAGARGDSGGSEAAAEAHPARAAPGRGDVDGPDATAWTRPGCGRCRRASLTARRMSSEHLSTVTRVTRRPGAPAAGAPTLSPRRRSSAPCGTSTGPWPAGAPRHPTWSPAAPHEEHARPRRRLRCRLRRPRRRRWERSRPGSSAPTGPASAPRLEESPRGRFVVSAVNGLFGDRLRDDSSGLAITMAVRVDGRDVALDPESLRAAFPEATGDLVVFLHGLARPRATGTGAGTRPGAATASGWPSEGWTPGLPAREHRAHAQRERRRDGRADGRLVAAWPVEVRRIALVGHSMGGLIMRAACAVITDATPVDRPGHRRGHPRHPAPGRPDRAGADRRVVRHSPGCPSRRRSAGSSTTARSGILDLRDGLARRRTATCRTPATAWSPPPLTALAAGTLGAIGGDLLVPYPSAVGTHAAGEEMFPGAESLHVPGADHFDLLNHDDVYAAIRGG